MKIEIKVPSNKYQLLSIVLAVALLIVTGLYLGTITGKFTSVTIQSNPTVVAQKTIDFINQNLLNGRTAKLVKVEDTPYGLYKIELEINGRTYTSYVTKDGKILFPSGIEMIARENTQTQTQIPEIPKRDVPEVKLFIMSHCPYGLQALKALIPVMRLLDGKADITINFVSYLMHGENELKDNNRIFCIQKVKREKLVDFLECYVTTGNSTRCIEKIKIPSTELEKCLEEVENKYYTESIFNLYADIRNYVKSFNSSEENLPEFTKEIHTNLIKFVRQKIKEEYNNSPFLLKIIETEINNTENIIAEWIKENRIRKKDEIISVWLYFFRYPKYLVDLSLSQKYGVSGSPTIVVNDKVVPSPPLQRSPEAFKEAICSAFTNPPEECNQQLSTKVMPYGFGPLEGSGSDSSGVCS